MVLDFKDVDSTKGREHSSLCNKRKNIGITTLERKSETSRN